MPAEGLSNLLEDKDYIQDFGKETIVASRHEPPEEKGG